VVTFSDFLGGLNLALPPESIAGNELQEALNFEYEPDTGALRTRGGMALIREFGEPVTDILNTADGEYMLVKSGGELYRLNIAAPTVTELGVVDGGEPASSELWGENGVVMCFGGHLYIYDPTVGLERISTEDAPTGAGILYIRDGRVCVASAGSDKIRMSAVGDARSWVENTDDDSASKSVEIGYKDGRDIRAIAATLGTVLVFKCPEGQPERGRIYRFEGSYPNWSVTPYSEGESAWNARSVANVGNDIMFLSRAGMANISSVAEYGDFKLGWAGAKVNPVMSKRLSALCSLRNVPEKNQLWALDGTTDDAWIYHYSIGGGAWTMFRFQETVTAVNSSNGVTLVAMGPRVYRMDNTLESDAWKKIDYRLKPRTIRLRNQVLLKHIMAQFKLNTTSEVRLRAEGMELVVKYDDSSYVFTDADDAYSDDEYLAPPPRAADIRRRCNIRRWALTPEIIVTSGTCEVIVLELEIAEV
jgi:hypothetical protein